MGRFRHNDRNLRLSLAGDTLVICNLNHIQWMHLPEVGHPLSGGPKDQVLSVDEVANMFVLPDHKFDQTASSQHEFKVFGQVLLGIFRHQLELADATYYVDTLVCKDIGPKW